MEKLTEQPPEPEKPKHSRLMRALLAPRVEPAESVPEPKPDEREAE